MEQLDQCPICGNTVLDVFLTAKDYTTSSENFHLVKCRECELVLTNPRPEANQIGKYYESASYISHTGGTQSLFDKVYLFARSIALRRKRKLVEKFLSKRTLLDYGCGTGEFLHHMKTAGWSVTGIEPSEAARKKAIALTEVSIQPDLNEISGKTFEVITLWHVIEHVHQLNETLAKLKSLLANDGTLVIAVPNYQSPDAQKYQAEWAAYDVPRHLWHFSKQAMQRLLKKHQLTLVDVLPMEMDSYYVSMLSERNIHQHKSKVLNFVNGFFAGLISNTSAASTKNYSSLIYIARR